MLRLMILVLIVALLAGCNLNSEYGATTAEEVLETASPTVTISATFVPTSTFTPTHTPMPQSPPVTRQTAALVAACTPRTEWESYIVVSGDTLYGIAGKVGTSAANLIEGNCIENPSLLSVGQTIRVPHTPLQSTVTPQPTAANILTTPTLSYNSIVVGSLSLHPYEGTYQNQYVLKDQTTVGMSWSGFPDDVVQAEFVFYPSNDPGNGYPIGIDNDLSDGTYVEWQVPEGAVGRVTASGRYGQEGLYWEAHAAITTWSRLDAALKAPPYDGVVTIAPHVKFENNTYYFERNAIVTISLTQLPINASYIEFYYQTTFTERENVLVDLGGVTYQPAGVTLEWHIPGGVEGYVYAVITLRDGSTVQTTPVDVYAEII